jgi:hypothetical protein
MRHSVITVNEEIFLFQSFERGSFGTQVADEADDKDVKVGEGMAVGSGAIASAQAKSKTHTNINTEISIL